MTFQTYAEANDYREAREAEMGKMRFRSTNEYRVLYAELQRLWNVEGHKRPTYRTIKRRICLTA